MTKRGRGRPHGVKPLDVAVNVRLSADEREQLRQILFNKGSLSLQAFFRQAVLQEIRAAGYMGNAQGEADA
jgi:hypothetical protein